MVKLNRVRVIELVEPDFFGTTLNHNIVMVEGGPSGGIMMIDTGLPGYLDEISKYLDAWGFSLEDISDVVVTHWHPDHSGNAEEIRRISKAKVYAHADEEEYLLHPRRFDLPYDSVKEELGIGEEEFQETLRRINGISFHPVTVDVKLKGGENLAGFKVIHVPGHTPGHIALHDGVVLVTGDAVRAPHGEPSPPLGFFSWDYVKALKSFKRLLSLPFRYLIPYHGEVVERW